MAASRLFFLLGASIVRNNHKPIMVSSPIHFIKPLPSTVVRFRRSNCTSATLETPTVEVEPMVNPTYHPWPEWVAFIDRLKSKGYVTQTLEDADGSIYTDMSLLKDACFSFSRDRPDIFRKLSTQYMQTVVGKGCPNLFRKVVNSGKRLRMHLNLDEGEVCGACDLRGSCDRAYLILKEDEGVARTVDIVRVLLIYALDPAVMSSGYASPLRKLTEAASRKLLSELIELSETPVDPEHHTAALPRKKKSLEPKDEGRKDIKMKRVDSIDQEAEKRKPGSNIDTRPGDWVCSQCNFMNFSRNAQCRQCSAEGPSRDVPAVQELKKGDWNCPQCTFMNFASNTKCKRCQEPRPKRQLNPGEWECPKCDFLNYRKNMVCKKCDCERPKDAKKQSTYEQQLWRKPY